MRRGFTILELIIGFGIVALLLPAMVKAYNLFSAGNAKNFDTFIAIYLNEEAQEAVRFLRDTSWSNQIATLNNNSWYGLSFSTSTNRWTSTTSAELIDGRYTRRFKLQPTRINNGHDNISTSSANPEEDGRYVITEVRWNDRGKTYVKQMESTMFNIFAN